jgi:hypothetical protein
MPETEKRKYVLEAEGKITSQTDWGFCWSDSPEAKAEKTDEKIAREKRGWKCQWVCSGVGPRLFIGGKL